MRKKSLEQIVKKNKGHEYLRDPLDRVSSVVLFVLVMLSLSVFLSVKYVDNATKNGIPTGFVVHHYKVINNETGNGFVEKHYTPEYPKENKRESSTGSMNSITGNIIKKGAEAAGILSQIKHSPYRTTIMMMLYIFWLVIVGLFQLYGHEKEIKKRNKK